VGIGGLVGAIAAFALIGRQRLASDFAFGLILWGIPIALIGIFPRPPFALFLLAIVGIGNTVVDVAALTLLQRTVPDEVLTRVFGVVQSVFIGTIGSARSSLRWRSTRSGSAGRSSSRARCCP